MVEPNARGDLVILAIDTSVGISVAVHDGTEIMSEISSSQHGLQGELTAQYLQNALAAAGCVARDITSVVVGVGPGPFTGLRVGITSALTFAHALDIPVHGLCSLDAIGFTSSTPCIAVTDARRKELYWAKYLNGLRVSDPAVNTPQEISELNPNTEFIGPGALLYPEFISGQPAELQAGNLANLFARGLGQILPVTPMYLRKPDAVPPTERKSVNS
jgi:tRNA threonylcarbamoyl adenosine modification protein YeaZ